MVSFLFWLIQIPFLYMHPNNLRWLFVNSIVIPIAWISILTWTFASVGGGDVFSQKATLTSLAYSWAFLSSLTSVIGNFATLSVNQADFSRYSKVSAKWQLMYVPVLPIVFTFISFIGVAVASAGSKKYNLTGADFPWDPMALVSNWENRACRFFAAFSLALAALSVNISANSLSAANDLTALSPHYINIRRGQLLFLNFMAAYAVFLGPITSIMLFDFWVLYKRKHICLALYQPGSIYRYTYGINWRAVVPFIIRVVPNLPSFINSINSNINFGSGVYSYQFGWLLSFIATTIVYLGLSYAFKPTETFVERFIGLDEIYDGEVVEGVDVSESKGKEDIEVQAWEGNAKRKG